MWNTFAYSQKVPYDGIWYGEFIDVKIKIRFFIKCWIFSDEFHKIIMFRTIGSCISLVCLSLAFFLISTNKKLYKITRNKIHVNLFASFILRDICQFWVDSNYRIRLLQIIDPKISNTVKKLSIVKKCIFF